MMQVRVVLTGLLALFGCSSWGYTSVARQLRNQFGASRVLVSFFSKKSDIEDAAGSQPKKYLKSKGLPSKICACCGREMVWRKSWAKNWEDVKYCSEKCRRSK